MGIDEKNKDITALEFSMDIDKPNRYQTADGEWHEGGFIGGKKPESATVRVDITTKITEENDRFIFETIYPFCCEKAQMVLKKSDLEEALLIWKAYKDGRLEWKPIQIKNYLETIVGSKGGITQ